MPDLYLASREDHPSEVHVVADSLADAVAEYTDRYDEEPDRIERLTVPLLITPAAFESASEEPEYLEDIEDEDEDEEDDE